MIEDPNNYTGLFTWNGAFVTIEHNLPNGRETTFLTYNAYEQSGIRPPLANLPTENMFKRGCWIGRSLR